MQIDLGCDYIQKKIVSGVKHYDRVATFGLRDPGSNAGKDRYIIIFKPII